MNFLFKLAWSFFESAIRMIIAVMVILFFYDRIGVGFNLRVIQVIFVIWAVKPVIFTDNIQSSPSNPQGES